MRIGIVGAGRIGGNAGRLFAGAGHEVMFSGSRDPAKLERLSADAGGARTGSPREAVEFGEVVMFSVPWRAIDDVLAQTGSLDGKVVIDTTNQYGEGGWEQLPRPAAQVNAERMPGARLVKAFNTLDLGLPGRGRRARRCDVPRRRGRRREEIVAGLIRDIGFEPVDVGGFAEVPIMEAPRRDGAVYGEEYSGADGHRIADALRENREQAAKLAAELRVAG